MASSSAAFSAALFCISSAAPSARVGSWSASGCASVVSVVGWSRACAGINTSARELFGVPPEGSSGLSHGLPHGLAAPYSNSDTVCCTWAGRCRRGCRDPRLAIWRSGIAFCHPHLPLPASYCVLLTAAATPVLHVAEGPPAASSGRNESRPSTSTTSRSTSSALTRARDPASPPGAHAATHC